MIRPIKTPGPVRGVVILYATIAIAMLGVMGSSLTDGSQATIDAVQSSVYSQMARYAAESGIEYAISALDSHLVQPCPTITVGPPLTISNDRLNPACLGTSFFPCTPANATSVGWADPAFALVPPVNDSELNCPGGTIKNAQIVLAPAGWGTNTPTLVGGPEAEAERTAARYEMGFRLAMSPRFDSQNVGARLFASDPPVQAIFHIRSRGIVRGGVDPTIPGGVFLLGHCTLVAKVRIGTAPCTSTSATAVGGKARVQRISMDIVPSTANDRPRTVVDYAPFPPVSQLH